VDALAMTCLIGVISLAGFSAIEMAAVKHKTFGDVTQQLR